MNSPLCILSDRTTVRPPPADARDAVADRLLEQLERMHIEHELKAVRDYYATRRRPGRRRMSSASANSYAERDRHRDSSRRTR